MMTLALLQEIEYVGAQFVGVVSPMPVDFPGVTSRGICPLLLSLAGGGLVSARQPARAAPAACVVLPIPAGARQPSACVSPP